MDPRSTAFEATVAEYVALRAEIVQRLGSIRRSELAISGVFGGSVVALAALRTEPGVFGMVLLLASLVIGSLLLSYYTDRQKIGAIGAYLTSAVYPTLRGFAGAGNDALLGWEDFWTHDPDRARAWLGRHTMADTGVPLIVLQILVFVGGATQAPFDPAGLILRVLAFIGCAWTVAVAFVQGRIHEERAAEGEAPRSGMPPPQGSPSSSPASGPGERSLADYLERRVGAVTAVALFLGFGALSDPGASFHALLLALFLGLGLLALNELRRVPPDADATLELFGVALTGVFYAVFATWWVSLLAVTPAAAGIPFVVIGVALATWIRARFGLHRWILIAVVAFFGFVLPFGLALPVILRQVSEAIDAFRQLLR